MTKSGAPADHQCHTKHQNLTITDVNGDLRPGLAKMVPCILLSLL